MVSVCLFIWSLPTYLQICLSPLCTYLSTYPFLLQTYSIPPNLLDKKRLKWVDRYPFLACPFNVLTTITWVNENQRVWIRHLLRCLKLIQQSDSRQPLFKRKKCDAYYFWDGFRGILVSKSHVESGDQKWVVKFKIEAKSMRDWIVWFCLLKIS
jgi:hypothetical protein